MSQDVNTQLTSMFNPENIKVLEMLLETLRSKKEEVKTLKEFHREYLIYSRDNHSEKYTRSIELSFQHQINHFGGEINICDIKTKDAEQFITAIRKTAPNGYDVYYRNLKAAFNKAKEWEYITVNPFAKIKLPKQQEVKQIFIGEDVLNDIISVTEKEFLRNMITFAFYTGCRVSEVVNIKWSNIDLNTGLITIGDAEFATKSRKQRIVPICDEINHVLVNLKLKNGNHNGYVFHKENGFPYTSEYISKEFKKVVRKAGVDESVHFHTLRHSFASNLVQRNTSLYIIKELMGHSSITVTERYSHVSNDALRQAINVFNKKAA